MMRLGSVDLVVLHGLCVEKLKKPENCHVPKIKYEPKSPVTPRSMAVWYRYPQFM